MFAQHSVALKARLRTRQSLSYPAVAPNRKSAYFHFSNALRAEVKREYPTASFGEVGKILGEWWAECSSDERAKYDKMAADDRARYNRATGGGGGGGGGGARRKATTAAPSKPSYLSMAQAAIAAIRNPKGSNHGAIEDWILANYPTLDFKRHVLRKTLKINAEKGALRRKGNSFKLAAKAQRANSIR